MNYSSQKKFSVPGRFPTYQRRTGSISLPETAPMKGRFGQVKENPWPVVPGGQLKNVGSPLPEKGCSAQADPLSMSAYQYCQRQPQTLEITNKQKTFNKIKFYCKIKKCVQVYQSIFPRAKEQFFQKISFSALRYLTKTQEDRAFSYHGFIRNFFFQLQACD